MQAHGAMGATDFFGRISLVRLEPGQRTRTRHVGLSASALGHGDIGPCDDQDYAGTGALWSLIVPTFVCLRASSDA